ncbi:MAG: SGNH/GDSL hydrolase family protein [Thaumarchaeota archaeon]|nr:SGNH/GDSL hydrolase family protein [Nitrososphaerota archaeon]
MSVQISKKKQFLFGLFFLITFLLIVEGITRTYEWIYPNCDMVNSEALKNVDIFYQRQMCLDYQQLHMNDFNGYQLYKSDTHYATVNINSQGFRGTEFSSIKEESTYRIFLIGASTTFGTGATSDDMTIPGLMQKKFDEIRPDQVKIINAGISAANSNTENKLILDKIVNYDPDLIIFYDGWADAWHRNIILAEIDPSHTDKSITASKKNLGIIDFFQNELRIYRTPIVIYKTFFWDKTTHYQENIETEDFEKLAEKISLNWKKNKSEICKLGHDKGFKTIAILQPILGTGNKPYTNGEKVLLPKTKFDIETLYILNKLEKPLNELNNICDKVLDMRNVFDNISQPIYFDKGHMNDYGNKIIADNIFESTKSIVLQDIDQILNK